MTLGGGAAAPVGTCDQALNVRGELVFAVAQAEGNGLFKSEI